VKKASRTDWLHQRSKREKDSTLLHPCRSFQEENKSISSATLTFHSGMPIAPQGLKNRLVATSDNSPKNDTLVPILSFVECRAVQALAHMPSHHHTSHQLDTGTSTCSPQHTRDLSPTEGIGLLRQKSLILHNLNQIFLSTTIMSFDSNIHENFAIRFSMSSPLGDPLGQLNKFSCLLDAKHILALSTPFADEPLQHTIADDCIEIIQDLIVCPLPE